MINGTDESGDLPIPLQDLMIEYHSHPSEIKYPSHNQTIQDIIPAVGPRLR